MKKTIYISFQDETARIYVNQVPPPEFPSIKDPDLKKGRGVPMHKWYPELFQEHSIMRLKRLHGVQMAAALAGALTAGLLGALVHLLLKSL